MEINRKHEIERAVSPDTTRPHIANAWLDREAGKLVATDGNMLAIVPVTNMDGSTSDKQKDETGYVSPAAIKQARKAMPKKAPTVVLGANGHHSFVDGSTMPRPQVDRKFPPYKDVMPTYRKGDAGTITIGFSPTLLLELAKAIGVGDGRSAVYLTFPTPSQGGVMLDPYVIEGSEGAIGCLMPCRL